MRGFNWEQSKFYIMYKFTDLFCLTILFAKFSILVTFILHVIANSEGCSPARFSKEAGA